MNFALSESAEGSSALFTYIHARFEAPTSVRALSSGRRLALCRGSPDTRPPTDPRRRGVSFGATPKAYWNPALTLWTFLCQLLDPDKSCRRAVARAILAFSLTTTPEEGDTASYCRARARIPAQVLQKLSRQVAQHVEDAAPTDWRWHGRRVHLVDGSTSCLPDTAANQAAFPQPAPQKPGLGFPLILPDTLGHAGVAGNGGGAGGEKTAM